MSEAQALVDDAVTLIVDHAPQSVGQTLRQAREARQLPLADVARALKLGERQLTALESDQWSELPGATFVRGFVRNYARLLTLDAAPLMETLDQQLEKPVTKLNIPASAPAEPAAGVSKKNDRSVMTLGLLLLLVAVRGYFLLPGDWNMPQGRILALLPERVPAVATVQEEKEAEPLYPPGTSNQELIAPVPETAPEAAAESLPAAAPPPAATPAVSAVPVETTPGAAALAAKHAATLRFVVSKEAWIEVRDSEQKVVFSQRLAPGSEQQVQGQGPLSVTVGYAPGVQLFLRGQQVDLAPHSRGDVARLVLE
jgi:cytoskeleton protein RodZ